jgi:protein-tyrosine phosphatase
MKILMVCLGNICRSPIAHGIMGKLIAENNLPWVVESAGTNGLHTGEHPHKDSIRVCKNHGIDISQQVSELFTTSDFDNYDVLYVMANDVRRDVMKLARSEEDQQKVKLFLNELYPNANKVVTDPWYGGPDGYEPVFEEIEKCCKAIIKKYA